MTLTTTNAAAQSINDGYIERLEGKIYEYHAKIDGAVGREYFPTEDALRLKKGAQVMFVNNNRDGQWVNGTVGKVNDIVEDSETGLDAIRVELSEDEVVTVLPHTWDVFRFSFDVQNKKLISETAGTFTQYPLRLAWAITIHKSQGKTFDRVIIDTGSGTFASGQLYVALSRCKTLDGIVLTRRIMPRDVITDTRVASFMKGK
jgi:ATP-dependent exoDNAse (exonuclease V) alpha subunit